MFSVHSARWNKDGLVVKCSTSDFVSLNSTFVCYLNRSGEAMRFRIVDIEAVGNKLCTVLAEEISFIGVDRVSDKHTNLDIRDLLNSSVKLDKSK